MRSHRLLSEALAAAGARGYEYRLLAALDELGPSSQAALGRAVGLDRRDVTVTLTELVDHGVVDRAPDPSDTRRNLVRLTAPGRARLRELDGVMDRVQDRLLAPLPPADRARLMELLTRLQP